jgi:hypothetical protein
MSLGVPIKGPPSRFFSYSFHRERDTPFLAPRCISFKAPSIQVPFYVLLAGKVRPFSVYYVAFLCNVVCSGFGCLEVSVLASGTTVRRSRRIFRAKKILNTSSFGGEVTPSVPCRKFTACKRTQKWRGRHHFRQNSRQFLAHNSTFRCWCSLASFQTWGTPGSGSWNVLVTGPPGWGLTCRWQWHSVKTFLLRILNDSWAGQNPQGLQCRLKKKKNIVLYI